MDYDCFVTCTNLTFRQYMKRGWMKDRDCHGGGLAVYVAKHLSFKRLDYINSEIIATIDLEMICFELSQPKSKNSDI